MKLFDPTIKASIQYFHYSRWDSELCFQVEQLIVWSTKYLLKWMAWMWRRMSSLLEQPTGLWIIVRMWHLSGMAMETVKVHVHAALQAATILVAMASEKNFEDQNSGKSRQLVANLEGFVQKLNMNA